MAKKKSAQSWGNMEFINYRLNAEEKKAFKIWYGNNTEMVFTHVVNTVASGYKLSMSPQDDGATFIAALTCVEEGNPNYQKCITSRSNDFWEAQALTIYKHLELSNAGIWDFDTPSNDWG